MLFIVRVLQKLTNPETLSKRKHLCTKQVSGILETKTQAPTQQLNSL